MNKNDWILEIKGRLWMAGWKSAKCGEHCLVNENMEVYHEGEYLYLRCHKGYRDIECSMYLCKIKQFYVANEGKSVFVTVEDGIIGNEKEEDITIALTEKGIMFV